MSPETSMTIPVTISPQMERVVRGANARRHHQRQHRRTVIVKAKEVEDESIPISVGSSYSSSSPKQQQLDDVVEHRMQILIPDRPAISSRIATLVEGIASICSSNGDENDKSEQHVNHMILVKLQELATILCHKQPGDGATVAMIRSCGHFVTVMVMKKYRTWPELQRRACLVLYFLCCNCGDPLVEIGGIGTIGISLGCVGAIECVVRAMKTFPTKQKLQSTCVITLSNLSYFDRNEALLVSLADGVPLVLNAMVMFPADLAIQQHGCRIMKHICKHNREYTSLVAEKGGIVVIADVVRRFPKTSKVYLQANKALRLLLEGTNDEGTEEEY